VKRTKPKRLGVTLTVAVGAILAFAAIGGTGLAGSLAKPAKAQYGPGQYVNPGKVTLCHKQKVTIRVSTRAVPAHQAHGDTVGTCAQARAAAKTKAKADKAAAKAEKASAKPGQSGQAETGNGQGKAKGKNK